MDAPCPFESEMVKALRGGGLAEEQRVHLAECAGCREALWLAEALSAEESQVEVPAAGLVYWRAEIRMRRERMEAAMKPAQWMERVAVAALMGAAVVVGVATEQPLVIAGTAGAALVAGVTAWTLRRA